MRISIMLLAFLTGGYMIADAFHALYTGNYIAFGGHLGPWTSVLALAHISPASLAAKFLFLTAGSMYVVIALDYARCDLRSARGVTSVAIGTLWYLPFGTLCSAIVLVLLFVESRQRAAANAAL